MGPIETGEINPSDLILRRLDKHLNSLVLGSVQHVQLRLRLPKGQEWFHWWRDLLDIIHGESPNQWGWLAAKR